MPAKTEPRSGLLWGWNYGENGWNAGMDGNLLRLGRFGFHLSVKDRDVSIPPSPTIGDCYLVAAAAAGDWAGRDGQIAIGNGAGWDFASPRVGWRAYVEDEDVLLVFKTGGWGVLSGGGGGGGGGIPEAPTDGQTYGRNDSTWVPVEGGSGFAPYRGARIRPVATQAYSVTGAWTALRFAASDRNSGNAFWDISAPNQLTVPVGVTKVRLALALQISNADTIASNQFTFYKNGSAVVGSVTTQVPGTVAAQGYNNPGLVMVSDTLDVTPGDYFNVMYFASESFSVAAAGQTWFAMEVVERSTNNAKLQELLDVAAPSPADGQSLVWDATAGVWKPGVPTVAYPGSVGMYKPFRGAMARLSADYTIATRPAFLPWQAVDYDTNGFWSAGQPTRMTIPAGVKKVRLHAAVGGVTSAWPSTESVSVAFAKNGSTSFRGNGYSANQPGYNDSTMTAVSGVIPVVAGDYFELRVQSSATGNRIAAAAVSQFSLEVVEAEETLP